VTSPGTRLVTLSGSVHSPGVYEVVGGATLGELIRLAGGTSEPVHAVLIGGYHGGWAPWTAAHAALAHTAAALHRFEAAPGAGVVIALPARRCGLQAGAEIACYLAGQNASQCGPCRNGMPAVAELLNRVARGRADKRVLAELHRVVGLIDGRGACQHPGGTAPRAQHATRL